MRNMYSRLSTSVLWLVVLVLPGVALAEHENSGGLWQQQQSAPVQPWEPNANAGYPGSSIPSGEYNPNNRSLDRSVPQDYTNSDNGLGGRMSSERTIVQVPGGRSLVCLTPGYSGRVVCR